MAFMERQELLRQLTDAEKAGKLSPKGQKVLDTLRAGPAMSGPVASLAAGASFETADELTAFVRSIAGGDYDTALRQERDSRAQYRSENPASATVLEIGGGAPVAALFPAAKTIGGAVAQGATAGAAYGFGAGEASPSADGLTYGSDGFSNRAVSAGAGAVVGGGLGGVTQAVLGLPFSYAYRSALERLRGPQARGNEIGDEVAKAAMTADSGSVEAAMAAQRAGAQGGRPFALADTGPNAAGTLDATKTLPGEGKQAAIRFLAERDKGMRLRVSDDIKQAFGTQDEFLATLRALEAARAGAGNALYTRALAMPINVSAPELTSLLSRPAFKEALAAGRAIYQNRGLPLPQPGQINAELLHIAKIGLDDMIGKAKTNPQGIGRAEMRSFMTVKNDLVDFLDNETQGAYAAARNQWAGESAIIDALSMGRAVFGSEKGMDFDLLSEQVARMSESERAAFRNGAAQAVLDLVNSGAEGSNLAARLVRTGDRQRMMKMLFEGAPDGDAKFARWMENIQNEITMKQTNMTNSLTAARQEAVAGIRDRVQGDKAPEGMGLTEVIVNAMRRASAGSRASFDRRVEEATAQRIASILTELDPAKLKKIEERLTGGGNIYAAVKAFAPEALPLLARAVVGPAAVGGMAGREAGRFDPAAVSSFVTE